MVSKISEGIKVSVETFYQQDYSNPMQHENMFAYRITIANLSSFSAKLIKRHWFIFDSDAEYREVEGEGVVGMQPIILPGEEYQYVSGCNLHTEMGRMHGIYTFLNQFNNKEFKVIIPAFDMVCPFKYN